MYLVDAKIHAIVIQANGLIGEHTQVVVETAELFTGCAQEAVIYTTQILMTAKIKAPALLDKLIGEARATAEFADVEEQTDKTAKATASGVADIAQAQTQLQQITARHATAMHADVEGQHNATAPALVVIRDLPMWEQHAEVVAGQ